MSQKSLPTNVNPGKGGSNGPAYRDGELARVGDEVVGYDAHGHLVAGILVEVSPSGFVHNCRVLPGNQMAALPLATVEDLVLAMSVLKKEEV